MIYIYQILGILLIPLIIINIKKRIKIGKEDKLRHKERYGITQIKKEFSKKIIWIHTASVGEFKSADFFIKNYSKKYTILLTTTTVSAAEYAAKKYGNLIIHQFAPLDIVLWVDKFLNFWKPSMVVWIESDLWPTTLNSLKKKNIKSILVNVRMSPKSFKRWNKFPFFYKKLLDSFSEIFAQSKIDQNRIIKLTNREVNFIGNLKFFSTLENRQENNNKNNETKLITLMFASTHENEEKSILPIIKELLIKNSNLRFIIAPRHPERAYAISKLCESFNLSASLESSSSQNKSNIIIIDSFGILKKYFLVSDIVFLGGSLSDHGGHNPIEPAVCNCVILTGSKIFNWQNIFEDMIKSQACIIIGSTKELKIELNNLINDKEKRKKMKNNAYLFAQKQFIDTKVLNRTINNYLES